MRKGIISSGLICTAFLLSGCVVTDKLNSGLKVLSNAFSTPTIEVSQLKPARVSSTEKMNRIAVIHDRSGSGSFLESNLSGAKYNNAAYFTLVERSAIDAILKEQKMTDGLLTDSATRVKLGKLTGADTLISATMSSKVDSSSYSEERTECVEKGSNFLKCKKSRKVTVRCTTKVAIASLRPKAVSIESGQIIFSKNYSQKAKSSVCSDSESTHPSNTELEGRAFSQIATELKYDVAPYLLHTNVDLMEGLSSKVPDDAEKMFEMGIDFVNEKLYKNGCTMFSKAQSKYSDSLTITYNNAVCAEFSADVEMAEALYGKAMMMTDEIDKLKLIIEGQERISSRVQDMQKLSSLSDRGHF